MLVRERFKRLLPESKSRRRLERRFSTNSRRATSMAACCTGCRPSSGARGCVGRPQGSGSARRVTPGGETSRGAIGDGNVSPDHARHLRSASWSCGCWGVCSVDLPEPAIPVKWVAWDATPWHGRRPGTWWWPVTAGAAAASFQECSEGSAGALAGNWLYDQFSGRHGG